jgi:pseudouridine-5'-monophosphatase
MGIATSAPRHYFEIKTSKRNWLFDLFAVTVTPDDISACKPAPDPFLKVAELLQADPVECVVFEDAPSGIQAAKAAGMTAIAIPPHGIEFSHYRHADIILDSLEDLDLDWLGIKPLGKREASSQ